MVNVSLYKIKVKKNIFTATFSSELDYKVMSAKEITRSKRQIQCIIVFRINL